MASSLTTSWTVSLSLTAGFDLFRFLTRSMTHSWYHVHSHEGKGHAPFISPAPIANQPLLLFAMALRSFTVLLLFLLPLSKCDSTIHANYRSGWTIIMFVKILILYCAILSWRALFYHPSKLLQEGLLLLLWSLPGGESSCSCEWWTFPSRDDGSSQWQLGANDY